MLQEKQKENKQTRQTSWSILIRGCVNMRLCTHIHKYTYSQKSTSESAETMCQYPAVSRCKRRKLYQVALSLQKYLSKKVCKNCNLEDTIMFYSSQILCRILCSEIHKFKLSSLVNLPSICARHVASLPWI